MTKTILYSRGRFCPEFIDKVYEIERSSFSGAYLWSKQTFHKEVNKHGLWVACNNGEPVGYLIAWRQKNRRCYIAGIAVSKKFRGQGIGAQLIKRAQNFYRRRSFKWMWLDVDVNNAAQWLYYRLGFRITKHSKKYQFISMSKEI